MAEIVELLFHMFICFVVPFCIVSIRFDVYILRSIRLSVVCGFILIILKLITIHCECVQFIRYLNNYGFNQRNGNNIRQTNHNNHNSNRTNHHIDDDIDNDHQQIQRQIKIASASILAWKVF